jgi:hypothetical protein
MASSGNSGTNILAPQWKQINDPKNLVFKFLQEEEDAELAAFGGITWLGDVLWGLAPDKQEKEVEKIQPLLNHVYDTYADYFEKSKTEDVSITKKEYGDWSVRMSSHSGKIGKAIYSKFKEKKDNTLNLHPKGIYVENYELDKKSYQVAIYSAKDVVTLQNDRIRLKGYNDLAENIYVKAGYTKKYGIIVLYEASKKYQLLLQISGADDPEKTAEQWLNYLAVVVASDEQKEHDKSIWDKLKDKLGKLFTGEELSKVWGEEEEEDILLDESGVWWVTQFNEALFGSETCWQNQCCNRASNKILKNAGTETNRLQQIIIAESSNTDCSELTGKATEFKQAVEIIDKSLKEHELPIMVGVQHPYGEIVKKYKCSNNIPKITNHYVVIIGKQYDQIKKQYYYLFYEVGTNDPNNGKSYSNRLYINESEHLIKGDTKYIDYSNYYIITEIRKNNNQIY